LQNINPFSFIITAEDNYSMTTCTIDVSHFQENNPPIVIPTSFSIPFFSNPNTFIGPIIAYDIDFNQTLSYTITRRPFSFLSYE